jgi:hypothetical protein
VQARQTELGCAEFINLAVVQVLGGQALKSVPSQMLFRYQQAKQTLKYGMAPNVLIRQRR